MLLLLLLLLLWLLLLPFKAAHTCRSAMLASGNGFVGCRPCLRQQQQQRHAGLALARAPCVPAAFSPCVGGGHPCDGAIVTGTLAPGKLG